MVRYLPLWVAAGCSGALPGPGPLEDLDFDEDGWALSDGDCNDADPAIHPLQIDIPLDDIDQDCDGADATALTVRGLSSGELVLTEIMADPVGVDGDLGEWFEVYNPLDVPVDLNGLLVRDLERDDFLVTETVVLEPEGYGVLGAWDDPVINGGVEVDHRYPASFGLSNGEDEIRLMVGTVVIDEVAWDPTWPLEAGRAIGTTPGTGPVANDDPDAWCAAEAVYGLGGYGTPGAPNRDCGEPFDGLVLAELQAGDLVITEVMQNPAAVDDDLGEWLEVTNVTDEAIDLRGLVVADEAGDDFAVETSLVVAAGETVVFGSSTDEAVNGGVPVDQAWGFQYGLRNSGQEVQLWAGTVLVDAIAYDNGLTFPDPEGASMRLDPSAVSAEANDDGAAWCVGSMPYGDGDLGTPGAPNPPC